MFIGQKKILQDSVNTAPVSKVVYDAVQELNEAIEKAISDAHGKSSKAILAYLDMDKLSNSKNRNEDIVNAVKALSENDDTSFLFESEKPQAKFTTPITNNGSNSSVTKESIMAIKDRTERIRAIAEHKDLFK